MQMYGSTIRLDSLITARLMQAAIVTSAIMRQIISRLKVMEYMSIQQKQGLKIRSLKIQQSVYMVSIILT